MPRSGSKLSSRSKRGKRSGKRSRKKSSKRVNRSNKRAYRAIEDQDLPTEFDDTSNQLPNIPEKVKKQAQESNILLGELRMMKPAELQVIEDLLTLIEEVDKINITEKDNMKTINDLNQTRDNFITLVGGAADALKEKVKSIASPPL